MIDSISNSTIGLSAAVRTPAAADTAGFQALLASAAKTQGSSGAKGDDLYAQAREAAEQLVASAMVMPLLEEVREQPLDQKLFHGGFTEDAFRQKLDTLLADRIVSSGKFPLVDSIYEHVTKRARLMAGEGVDKRG